MEVLFLQSSFIEMINLLAFVSLPGYLITIMFSFVFWGIPLRPWLDRMIFFTCTQALSVNWLFFHLPSGLYLASSLAAFTLLPIRDYYRDYPVYVQESSPSREKPTSVHHIQKTEYHILPDCVVNCPISITYFLVTDLPNPCEWIVLQLNFPCKYIQSYDYLIGHASH